MPNIWTGNIFGHILHSLNFNLYSNNICTIVLYIHDVLSYQMAQFGLNLIYSTERLSPRSLSTADAGIVHYVNHDVHGVRVYYLCN